MMVSHYQPILPYMFFAKAQNSMEEHMVRSRFVSTNRRDYTTLQVREGSTQWDKFFPLFSLTLFKKWKICDVLKNMIFIIRP